MQGRFSRRLLRPLGYTNLKPQIDREAEIQAMGKALVIEKRARYTDFQGKRSSFSEFMRRSCEKLTKRYPVDLRWTTLRALFKQYPHLDLASRIAVIRRSEEILFAPPETAPSALTGAPEAGPPAKPQKSKQRRLAESNQSNQAAPSPLTTTQSAKLQIDVSAKRKGSGQKTGSEEKASKMTNQSAEDPRDLDVQFVRGVGPKMAELLERLDIKSAEDLLRHYPRQHLDFQNRCKISQLKAGDELSIFGTIRSVGAFQSRKGNVSILSLTINDGTGSIFVRKFVGGKSNKYLLERYKSAYPKGAQVIASGRVELDSYSKRLELKNAEIEVLGVLQASGQEMESLHTGRLVPVYPLTEGLSLRTLRSIMHNALETFAGRIIDPLPAKIKESYKLIDRQAALWGIHFPESIEEKDEARYRLVFEELFLAQMQLALRRHAYRSSNEALALPQTGRLLEKFREALPFELTSAQERVFAEIARDLGSDKPMHRLVQGDVGSGKTVVAAMAALVAIENNFQVAVMAPTEILAEQHYRQFQKWLSPLGLKTALLLGKQGVKERRLVQQGLAGGQVHVAVGTHALIQDDVEFANLGFVVIDEQHRFGVKQRASLKAKGKNPELLTMTATPIPRTLALSLHGDLDLSEIDELPPGRKPVKTEFLSPGQKKKLHTRIKEEIFKGRQAYIVFPLIEESESLSAKAATAEFEKLRQSEEFAEISIDLMHGKLKSDEKDQVMEKFRKGETKILVSTTVIEVGVDVPNASIMLIENADRFGLAQLHQLRGRVGRGADQSYCYLIADARSEQSRQRLGIMTETNDGFVIAEKDLELRGPGEFLGVRQSGLADLSLADIVKDAKILELARQAALDLVKEDPELKGSPALKQALERNTSQGAAGDLLNSG